MAELRCSYDDYQRTPHSVIEYLRYLIPQRRALSSEPRWEN